LSALAQNFWPDMGGRGGVLKSFQKKKVSRGGEGGFSGGEGDIKEKGGGL